MVSALKSRNSPYFSEMGIEKIDEEREDVDTRTPFPSLLSLTEPFFHSMASLTYKLSIH